MPELPDIELYVHCLQQRIVGRALQCVEIRSPFLLRTVEPPIDAAHGRTVRRVQRIGKRIALGLDGELHLVVHLMIAGRLRWYDAPDAVPRSRIALGSMRFETGSLVITEAGTAKRASLHVVAGTDALRRLDRGGLEVLDADRAAFAAALRRENHTLKRSLTDPRIFSGIGNAYSDEILHRARLSPTALSRRLDDAAIDRLFDAAREILTEWTARLRRQHGDGFPGAGQVTAFRPEMAVHGKYGAPCPVCATAVQRIVYAQNEVDYCPRCQTGGRILADRSLSRLLRADWPRTIEQLEGPDEPDQ